MVRPRRYGCVLLPLAPWLLYLPHRNHLFKMHDMRTKLHGNLIVDIICRYINLAAAWPVPVNASYCCCSLAGRRSLLAHWPDDHDGRLLLTSVAPLGRHAPPPPQQQQAPASVSGGEEGGEGVDDAAADCWGFWTELEPGIYSLGFFREAPPGMSDEATAMAAAESHAVVGPAALPVGWLRGGGLAGAKLQRHIWHDPLLVAVQRYGRSYPAAEPAAQLVVAVAGSGNAVAASDSSSRPAAEASIATLTAVGAAGTSASPGSKGCISVEAAAQVISDALQAAVNVRLATIDRTGFAATSSAISTDASSCTASCNAAATSIELPALLPPSWQPTVSGADAASPLLPEAPLLVLFSGGVDSVLLAALAHRCLPPGAPIDLANVCFDAGRSPDRQAAIAALQELRQWAPQRNWRLLEVSKRGCTVHA